MLRGGKCGRGSAGRCAGEHCGDAFYSGAGKGEEQEGGQGCWRNGGWGGDREVDGCGRLVCGGALVSIPAFRPRVHSPRAARWPGVCWGKFSWRRWRDGIEYSTRGRGQGVRGYRHVRPYPPTSLWGIVGEGGMLLRALICHIQAVFLLQRLMPPGETPIGTPCAVCGRHSPVGSCPVPYLRPFAVCAKLCGYERCFSHLAYQDTAMPIGDAVAPNIAWVAPLSLPFNPQQGLGSDEVDRKSSSTHPSG